MVGKGHEVLTCRRCRDNCPRDSKPHHFQQKRHTRHGKSKKQAVRALKPGSTQQSLSAITAFENATAPTTSTATNPARILSPDIFETFRGSKAELLMAGISSETYRLGDQVIKTPRLDDDEAIAKQNFMATYNEASVYILLGDHQSIAKCLRVGSRKSYVLLEYYPNGTLKDQVLRRPPRTPRLKRWARQIIESAVYIHSKGVRHSDFRLDQWLLDRSFNARLSDFNGSGYDANQALGLEGCKALGNETASHYLPRDPMIDSTVESDIFALGSVLYELTAGQKPFEGLDDDTIESYFMQDRFPDVEGLPLSKIISGCWRRQFSSADRILECAEQLYGI